MSARRRKTWVVALKALAGLALLAIVVTRLGPREVWDSLREPAWGPLAVAFLAQLAGKFVWAARWREILRANGLERGFWTLFRLVFIGLFFNNFLPTSVGGDLIRGYYVSSGKEGMAASYAVLLVERAVGLILLLALAGVAALVALLAGDAVLPTRLLAAVVLAGLGGAVVGALAFAWKGWREKIAGWRWLGARLSGMVAQVSSSLDLFRRAETRRTRIVIYSLGVQLVGVIFHVACARAVGLDTPTLVFFLIVPASIVVTMLPISLNGLGLREGVLVGLLVAYGAPPAQAGAFALLALVVATLFALAGGLIYPFHRMPATEDARVPTDA